MPASFQSDTASSNNGNAEYDDERDDASTLNEDEGENFAYMDTDNDAYAEGIDDNGPMRSPSFQMRVLKPSFTGYESSNEYSAEALESTAQEWSGNVQELPAISEEGSATGEATDFIHADVKRRSSDSGVQSSIFLGSHGMRRVSTMTDYQRLKGRHKLPKLVAFKADPAGPVITAMSVQPAEAWKVASVHEDGTVTSVDSNMSSRRTSQTIRSDLGISQMVWEEPSSSSDSEITVLTGTGIDYIVADQVEGDYPSPSPMERLKTKLKAWSWERELSEASPEHRSRFVSLQDAEERSHMRQSSDYLEHPPGPPNTVRHSGQSSTIHSDPQTPADLEILDDDADESGLELKAMSSPRPIQNQRTIGSTATTGDYLNVPRRTNSLPSSPSVPEGDNIDFPHRDSVDISHARMAWDEIKNKRDQELIMNSRDSFVITKSRLEAKHPNASASFTPPSGVIRWNRFGGLDTITDASPPSVSLLEARKAKGKIDEVQSNKVEYMEMHERHADEHRLAKGKHKAASVAIHEQHADQHRPDKGKHKAPGASKKKVEVVETPKEIPDEHDDCPICETHRPRWFETEHREW